MDSELSGAPDAFGLVGETLAGRFRIERQVAEGGFGVVYRALQLALDRPVALKVLRPPMDQTAEPPAAFHRTFETEARTIARLKHPHIVEVYDFGVAQRGSRADLHWMALEWLQGRTLEEMLAERRATPHPRMEPAEVLDLLRPALQSIAFAHQANVVHRDLKPSNIVLVEEQGRLVPKVLDFGIAQMVGPRDPGGGQTTRGLPAFSPDYAAPEQVSYGRTGPWTDVHALGLILSEMLAGQVPYPGASREERFEAAVSERRPTPGTKGVVVGAWEPVLARALARRPADRHPDAHALLRALEGTPRAALEGTPRAALVVRPRAGWRAVSLMAAAVALAAAGALAWRGWRASTSAGPQRGGSYPGVIRFTIPAPAKSGFLNSAQISPDGRQILYGSSENPDDTPVLRIRAIDAVTERRLPGTEHPANPFWAPDSRSVGFFQAGKLKTIDLATGAIRTLCDTDGYRSSASWSQHGEIIFAAPRGPVLRVAAGGGQPRPATVLDEARGEVEHRWPSFLPDGRRFLFVARIPLEEQQSILVGSLDGNELRPVSPGEGPARYAAPGYMLYQRDATPVAQPFDARAARVFGEAFPLPAAAGLDRGRTHLSVSSNGILLQSPAGTAAGGGQPPTQLVWYDRAGRRLGVLGDVGDHNTPSISRNGERIVVAVRDRKTSTRDIWLYELDRGTGSRVTFERSDEVDPVFLPDGEQILFASDLKGQRDVYRKPLGRVGEGELVVPGESHVQDVSPDGLLLLYGASRLGLWLAPIARTGPPTAYLVRPFDDHQARISPDGRWVAFTSNEAGRREVYVQDFPRPTRKRQISNGGGTEPAWRGDGRELFYLSGNRRMMAVDVGTDGKDFKAGIPRALFEVALSQLLFQRNRYVVRPDGQRFLIITPVEAAAHPPITVVVNWHLEAGYPAPDP